MLYAPSQNQTTRSFAKLEKPVSLTTQKRIAQSAGDAKLRQNRAEEPKENSASD
jgi:hypothetical protein